MDRILYGVVHMDDLEFYILDKNDFSRVLVMLEKKRPAEESRK